MKSKLSTVVKKTLKSAAYISSETTSWFGLYQAKTPKSLIKSDKK